MSASSRLSSTSVLSQPAGRGLVGALVAALAAIAIGLGIGALAGFDPLLGHLAPVKMFNLNRWMPFLFSALAILVIGGIVAIAMGRDRLFARRDALLILLVLVSGATGGINLGRLELTDFTFVLVVLAWLGLALIERRPFVTPMPILLIGLGLLACSLWSIVNGLLISLISQHMLATKILLLIIVSNLTAREDLYRLAARTVVVLAIVSALIAIASEIAYVGAGFALTMEDLPEYQYKHTPLGTMLRATAFLPTTQGLAHLLLLGASLTLFIPMRLRWRLVALFIMALGIGFTFSTGAYIALALIVLLSVFIRRPDRTVHYIAYLVLFALIAYVSGAAHWVYDKVIEPIGGKGSMDRIGYLRVGFRTIAEHPLAGIGLKNISRVLYTPVHNAYVQFAAEMGVLAGALFATLTLYLTGRSGAAATRVPAGESRLWLTGLFLGMIALAVHLFFEPFYENYLSWAYMGIVAGAIAHHDWQRLTTLRRPAIAPATSGFNGQARRN